MFRTLYLAGTKYDLKIFWFTNPGVLADIKLIDISSNQSIESWQWTCDVSTWYMWKMVFGKNAG